WASAMLEDLRGTVELIVFPQALQQLRDVLKADAALLVKGRVRHEENSRTKVVVNDAKTLESAVNGARTELRIRVTLSESTFSLIEELEKVLGASPGDSPVVFELTRPGDFLARLRPRRPRAVKADAKLLARLRALCGEASVWLERKV
ncbi:MAG: hypothetical protein DMG23_04755, partial [Acidobacteria bacterium]